jgi:hypothetical protein
VRRLGVLAAVLLVVLPSSGSAAGKVARAGVFTGYGFDACTAPSSSALNAWSASPYRALGIYLGGVNRACSDGNLSASWVTSTLAAGWSLMPLYVGLQAPCVAPKLAKMSSSPATAANQGRAAADDAVSLTAKFGLPGGTPIYLDMEGYSTKNAACTQAVQAFVSGWVNELRANGFVAGVYGSAASTMRDIAALGSSLPDAAWIANWNGVEGVFNDPYVSDSLWANHQRIHQYKGGHRETWGGVTINIDSNYVDGPVLGGLAPPPPPPPPPAGSVGSGDNRANVSWPDGAFPTSVSVALTPLIPPPANGYAVQLTVTDTDTSTAVTTFGAPVRLHLTLATGLVPSFSTDGVTWAPLPRSSFTAASDGGVDIQTTVPGYFGLLPDTVPPTRPDGVTGRFVEGSLRLTWPASVDNAGPVASYNVLLDGLPLQTVTGASRRAIVHSFHPDGPTVYRVQAVDAVGNVSTPSPALVVVPTKRPTGIPRALPRWAWGLYDSQHGRGARPAKAPKKPPAWYWRWAAWRSAPFHLRGR